MDFRLEEKESFAVVGIGKKFTGKTGAHLTQAEKFWTKDLEKSTEEMLISLANGNPDRFGVCSDFDDEGFKYSITVECDSEYPDCFERIVIPKNLWAIFTIKGRYAPVLQEVWDRIFSEWFPTSEYEHVEGPEIDLYHTSTDKEQRYSEVWIPVRKKK